MITMNSAGMIWQNIKASTVHLSRLRNIALLNIFGLSIGLSVALLIFLFVDFELSYDSFHKNGNLIYRIISVSKGTVGTEYRATTPKTVFDDPGSVVITHNKAKKLFGSEDPSGQKLIIGDNTFTVTGILKDLPGNSRLAGGSLFYPV